MDARERSVEEIPGDNVGASTQTGHLKDPATLKGLLDAMIAQNSRERSMTAMLRRTCEHISNCLGKPTSVIQVAQLITLSQTLKTFLAGKGYDPTAVQIYLNYLQVFVKTAEELGWMEGIADLQRRWREILKSRPKGLGGVWASSWAVGQGIDPDHFGAAELDLCASEAIQRGHAYVSVCHVKRYLRRLMTRQKLGSQAAGPKPVSRERRLYGTPLSEMGQPLRKQVEELVGASVAPPGYPKQRGESRPITKEAIRNFLCRFVGYVTRVRGSQISSVDQLLARDLLREFLDWSQGSRGVKGSSLTSQLEHLYAAVKNYQNPPLAGKDFRWIRELMRELRRESPAQIRQRKAARWVDYELLERIPARIRAQAEALRRPQGRQLATLRRDELIFTWLLILPWRSRNLRECRVGEEDQGGNLFKCELTPFSTVAQPDWVKQALRVNSHEKFWMFYFREHETMSGWEVRSLLPQQLIAPLEEYLRDYRPTLLGDNHQACSALFPNRSGQQLSDTGLCTIVANHTIRYAGKRLNPQFVRDIVAVTWLDQHPDDYLTIAKLLWHRDVLTTLRVYGRNLEESYAVCRMETWLKSRPKQG
jgi:integrase